jgi:hypothetical protein
MTSKIANLKMNQEMMVKNIGWNANKVIGTVIMLQERYGLSYLVGGKDGQITIKRTK